MKLILPKKIFLYLLLLVFPYCSFGVTVAPIGIQVTNRNQWPTNLQINFQLSNITGNLGDATWLPPGPSSFVTIAGHTTGQGNYAFFFEQPGVTKLHGSFTLTYTATINNDPRTTVTGTYPVKIVDNYIEPISNPIFEKFHNNVCEFATTTDVILPVPEPVIVIQISCVNLPPSLTNLK